MIDILIQLQDVLFYKGIGSLIAYIACTALAIMVLIKNPRNKLNIIFSAVSFVASAWNMIVYFIIQTASSSEATMSWKLYSVTTILLLTLLTYFCSELANKKIKFSYMLLTLLIITPLVLFTDIFITGSQEIGGIFFQVKSPLFIVLELYRLSMILTCIYFLYSSYSKSDENVKGKIRLVGIGIGVSLSVAILDIFLRLSGASVLPFSSLMSILTMAFMAYSFQVGDSK